MPCLLGRRHRQEPGNARCRTQSRRYPGLGTRIELDEGRAESLPFADASFDALTVTYLLRYVDDPAATIHELVRVVRPGGTVASLEFASQARSTRVLWELYVRLALPLAGRLLPPGWHEVGRFLGPSIRDHEARLPLERQLELGRRPRGHPRTEAQPRRGSGRLGSTPMRMRPAFYALAQGGWRDYVTLLHPPYTLWHLSYVAIGAALAPGSRPSGCSGARGVPARSRRGRARPRRTSRPAAANEDPNRRTRLACRGLSDCRVAIGIGAALAWTLWLLPFVAVGAFLVLAYALEACRRPLPHRPLVRARMGRLPGSGGIPGRGRDATARGISRGGVRCSRAWPSARSRQRSGRCGAGSRR